jgi:nucleoside-diphosphate-sugar epimerase
MILNIIQLAKEQSRLKRFVFASTSEIYAGTLQKFRLPIPTPETAPLALPDLDHPRTSYMLSKIYGEALIHQAQVPFTIVRPHNFYGPRMGLSHVIPELLKKAYFAKMGDSIEVYSIDHRRTFCFIRDAIEMIYRAAESPESVGQVLNIGTQEPEVTIGELAKKVVAAVGKRLEIVPGPETPGSPARRCPDMTCTRQLTGYWAQISLEEGIRETYDWYRTHVFDGRSLSAQ